LGKAIESAQTELQAETARLQSLREQLIDALQRRVEGARIIGSRRHRIPMNVHLCIAGVQGESVLLALDSAGICASAGSACTAGSSDPSHVLKALGIDRDLARGALRLTLGKSTDSESISYTVDVLAEAVRDLREMSAAHAS
jgi:cysteine desulfurase